MTTTWLPEHEWLASLVRAYVGSSVLLTDPDGNVLLLKASYRDSWLYPGGVIDQGESPEQCAARELREETGLSIQSLRLVVVEWRDPLPEQGQQAHPAVQFMFDGGTVSAGSVIHPQAEEVAEYGFFSVPRALELLHPHAVPRLVHALRARRDGGTALLHSPGYLG
ncbi:NUDIX domain-containing protein [Saccharothrix sp. ST-888]|uniref:NUDIX domain-containing protein n=1 Tax=Saccharothrix sp. ST-888 TaxID=1427391 RepID=UPI0005EC1672|nr:NUDIX hydrolase [Saccharothrix sp. ST-888]KJK54983.1 hypothetical protein UK12_31520 [Saccharothrix sp. ST-888]